MVFYFGAIFRIIYVVVWGDFHVIFCLIVAGLEKTILEFSGPSWAFLAGLPGVTRKGRGTGNAGQGEGLLGAEEPHYPCSGLPVAFTGRSLDPWKSSKPAYLRKALFLASLGLLRALWVLS